MSEREMKTIWNQLTSNKTHLYQELLMEWKWMIMMYEYDEKLLKSMTGFEPDIVYT